MNLVQEQVIALRQSSFLSVLHTHQSRPALNAEAVVYSSKAAFQLEQNWKNEINRVVVARGAQRLSEDEALAKLRASSRTRVAI